MLERRSVVISCFFFQAEDGIRYLTVTGVQTCALPIFERRAILLELGIRDGLFEFDDLLIGRTCCLSPGSTAGEQSQQRDYESAFHWYPLGDRWRDTSSVHGLLPARHRSREECQSVLETLGRRHLTLVVPQADDNQVMRWNDQRVLAAHTRHVVGVPRDGKRAVTVYPEEGPVDRTMIGCPRRSHGAHELHEPLR